MQVPCLILSKINFVLILKNEDDEVGVFQINYA